ncbi:hypothetical protein V3471_15020 [Flavobacterium oreochromis]|uniref:hypothetical protein n=1 Tax=Flavobacterium oreochromis TaxID=2906078 RepID=UPI00385EA3AE
MAVIFKNEKNFKIIKMNYEEFFSTGGFSICDSCTKPMVEGYFIAVLNHSYCEYHFNNWINSAVNYPEDRDFEEFTFNRMKYFLGM